MKEVVAVDVVPEVLAEGRSRAEREFTNVTFVEGDVTNLPFEDGSFDLAASVRTLHHVPRPELVVAELTRVIGFSGQVLIVDQIAPIDPLGGLRARSLRARTRPFSHPSPARH